MLLSHRPLALQLAKPPHACCGEQLAVHLSSAAQ
jgi:hypothetical protein